MRRQDTNRNTSNFGSLTTRGRMKIRESRVPSVLTTFVTAKLLAIAFFDAIAYGLVYAFVSTHILRLGGDNLTLGILAVSTTACQVLSRTVVIILKDTHDPKTTLLILFSSAILSHLLLIAVTNYWLVIIARCLFSLTNQVPQFTKAILIQLLPDRQLRFYLKLTDMLTASGVLIGPIIAGYLFDIGGFVISCLFATVLTITKVGIILSVPEEILDDISGQSVSKSFVELTITPESKTIIGSIKYRVNDVVKNFRNSNQERNWDLTLVKFLFTTSTMVFFSKFTHFLKYNLNCDARWIGLTISYMNALCFASVYVTERMKTAFESYELMMIVYYCFSLWALSLFIACHCTNYYIYVVTCIPVIGCRTLINKLWTDVFSCRGSPQLKRLIKQVGTITGLTVPIIFGVCCNIYTNQAVVVFSIVPPIICLFILRNYSLYQPCILIRRSE